MNPEGSDRLAAAFSSALRRLESAAGKGPAEDIFVDLGETLFWLHAFAEANDRGGEPTVLAMRWARDHIAHGLIVVAPVTWHDGSGLTRMMPARRGYGWLARSAIPAHRQSRGKRQIATDNAYDARAVGRDMFIIVRAAFREAGGTI
jgi:hypothetical protein